MLTKYLIPRIFEDRVSTPQLAVPLSLQYNQMDPHPTILGIHCACMDQKLAQN